INFKLATRPLLLIPVGALYFGLYYGLFRFFIQKFDLKTPGRETQIATAISAAALQAGSRGEGFILALGGAANLATIDACTTRLRLIVNDQSKVDEAALRALGAKGMVRPSEKALQVVLGPIADQVAGEIRAFWNAPAGPAPIVKSQPVPAVTALDAGTLLTALGGKGNVAEALARSSRLLVTVRDGAKIAEADLARAAPRGVVRTSETKWQIIVGEEAEGLALGLAG
ncbi:MAG TPA: glucose PTS transporter subunit EIIB, partial [Magnetospirillaceae bacterium]|nr:glucose PTS transporter subunit EIIB [Magnetospirillaceae bacterium]